MASRKEPGPAKDDTFTIIALVVKVSYADKNWTTAPLFTIVGDQPRRWFTSR